MNFHDRKNLLHHTRYMTAPGPSGGTVLAQEDDGNEGAYRWLMQDYQGSTALLVNKSGGVTQKVKYDGRGAVLNESGEKTRFGYVGRQYDEESGLQLHGARYYAGGQGRFISRDPLSVTGPDGANVYLYARNDYPNRVDLDGHASYDRPGYTYRSSYIGLEPGGPDRRVNTMVGRVNTMAGAGGGAGGGMTHRMPSSAGAAGPGYYTTGGGVLSEVTYRLGGGGSGGGGDGYYPANDLFGQPVEGGAVGGGSVNPSGPYMAGSLLGLTEETLDGGLRTNMPTVMPEVVDDPIARLRATVPEYPPPSYMSWMTDPFGVSPNSSSVIDYPELLKELRNPSEVVRVMGGQNREGTAVPYRIGNTTYIPEGRELTAFEGGTALLPFTAASRAGILALSLSGSGLRSTVNFSNNGFSSETVKSAIIDASLSATPMLMRTPVVQAAAPGMSGPPAAGISPVAGFPRVGSALKVDGQHGWSSIIDNYAGAGQTFSIPTRGPGGVIVRQSTLHQVEGSLNGNAGVFEWVVDQGQTTHRRFIPGGTTTGIPNQLP